MKLGEALRLRSDNYAKIEELRSRAVANAQVQEGTPVPEAPADVLARIEKLSRETLSLVQRVNRTNVAVRLPSGQTLADAIAERDSYLRLRTPFVAVAEAAGATQQRYLRSEIKVVRTVDPVELRAKADALALKHRELDAAIQEANWSTELLD